MARPTPSMEMFLVGAYLQLVEGCESVTYHSELPNPKESWVDVVGRSEARQGVFYVDFPDKFDWYPRDMRPDTLVRKMVHRFLQIWQEGRELDYPADNVHCQLWVPQPPAERVAEALPKVVERLREQHYIALEVIDPDEFRRRIPPVVQAVRKQAFDYDNLFIRAVLLADGRLDYQQGAPMSGEQIAAMYTFPATLDAADQIPDFTEYLLTSPWVVHWLDFDSPSLDELRLWLEEVECQGPLVELRRGFRESGEAQSEFELEDWQLLPRRYSADEVADLTARVFACAEDLRAQIIADQGEFRPLPLEAEFMVPFLSRAVEIVEPSVIEREILRYGGSRDLMMSHFSERHPDKAPYRAILRVELYEPGGKRLPGYGGGETLEVPIADPVVSEHLHAALSIHYATYFTGYFLLMMRRFAASL